MSGEEDDREQVVAKLLDEFQQLVLMAAQETASGDTAECLTATIDGMTEARAKAMLIARIAAESVAINEIAERIKTAPFDALGPDPTLN